MGFKFESSVTMSISVAVSLCLSRIPISILPSSPTPRHLSLVSASLLAICIPVPHMSSKLDSTKFYFQFPVKLSLISYSVKISERYLVHIAARLLSSTPSYQSCLYLGQSPCRPGHLLQLVYVLLLYHHRSTLPFLF